MSRREARHVRRRGVGVALVVVCALIAATGVAWWRGDLDRWLGSDEAPAASAELDPPPGVTLDDVREPLPVLAPADGPTIDSPAMAQRVRPLLAPARFGERVGLLVHDLTHDTEAFRSADGTYMPASTTKLLTSAAALHLLGPDHRFTTSVVRERVPGGPPRVVLVGGGDPLLAAEQPDPAVYPRPATLDDLVEATVDALETQGVSRVRVAYDDSLFTGPSINPTWEDDYVPGVTTPTSALWVDEGVDPDTFVRSLDPALLAGQRFAAALRAEGLRVVGEASRVSAAPDATTLAAVDSPPVEQVVGEVLGVSDNEAADVLLHHVGIAGGEPASWAGGSRVLLRTLGDLGVPADGTVVRDGSGLSRANSVSLDTLVGVLRAAADPDRPELRGVVTGLPVAGFDGGLADRYRAVGTLDGRGLVRAKTGTLTLAGTHALAGYTVDEDGTLLAYAVVANGVQIDQALFARDQLARVTAALTTCGCAR